MKGLINKLGKLVLFENKLIPLGKFILPNKFILDKNIDKIIDILCNNNNFFILTEDCIYMITETKNYILSYKNKDYNINILSDFLVLKHKENHTVSIYKNDDIDTNTLKNIKDIYYSGNTILYKDFNDKYYYK